MMIADKTTGERECYKDIQNIDDATLAEQRKRIGIVESGHV